MKKLLLSSAIISTSLAGFSMPAMARDLTQAGLLDKERFQLRGRIVGVFADGDGVVDGTALETDVGDAVTPELDLTYFFTEHVAIEAIAGTAQHEVSAGTLDLGETWILPPTLTLQYHFTPDQKFSPYIGAGINYSLFYGEEDGTGFDDLDIKGGFGYALQAGADYWFNEHWGVNFDAKYIDLEVDADVTLGGTRLHANSVDLNPWIVGVGVSYRF